MSVTPAAMMAAPLREAEAPLFVINLCASTTPVALTPPTTPELKRFNFFVTRQREDGRERFRLHMGYFATQDEADSVLAAVRDVYPAAWSGPAPNNRAANARARAAAPPVSAMPAVAAASMAAAPAVAAPTVAAPTAAAPTVAAPTMAATRVAVPTESSLVTASVAAPASAMAPAPKPVAPAVVAQPMPAARASQAVAAPASPPRPVPEAAAPSDETLDAMSNVREVLALLTDDPPREAGGPSRAAGGPAARKPAQPPTLTPAPTRSAQPVPPATGRPVGGATTPSLSSTPAMAAAPALPAAPPVVARPALRPAPTPAPSADAADAVLTASQTLNVLESPVPTRAPGSGGDSDIRVITPEDTQTLRDISLDAQNAAPPAFAVQLCWSVTPIDVGALTHLAIFDAYTLYNVEGSRQGRKWYGLRLGFFKDPDAARQVAHYVRSDYAAVAVVPVTTKERDRASATGPVAEPSASGSFAAPLVRPPDAVASKLDAPPSDAFTGFELLQDDRPPADKRDVDDVAPAGTPPVLKPALRQPGVRAAPAGSKPATAKPVVARPAAKPVDAKPTGKRAVARKPRPIVPGAPQPLEETLEILGASTLTIDQSHEVIREPLSRDQPKKAEKGAGARFARLLTRLSNRG